MSGPSKALESGALCRSCGACCVAPSNLDGWAGLEDDDLPVLKRVRLRIVHDADLRPLIATEQREIPEPERQLADVIRRLRDAWLERQIALRNGRLADPTVDDDDRLTLLSELQALRLRKRSPLEPIA